MIRKEPVALPFHAAVWRKLQIEKQSGPPETSGPHSPVERATAVTGLLGSLRVMPAAGPQLQDLNSSKELIGLQRHENIAALPAVIFTDKTQAAKTLQISIGANTCFLPNN